MQTGKELITKVRIGFIAQGSSLGKFCTDNKKDMSNVRKALLGEWNGEKGQALREFIVVNALGSNDESMD